MSVVFNENEQALAHAWDELISSDTFIRLVEEAAHHRQQPAVTPQWPAGRLLSTSTVEFSLEVVA